MFKRIVSLGMLLLAGLAFFQTQPAAACGGFFCQNSPVDQAAERILYTVNDNGTITTLIEIQYTGAAPDFSWILPIPEEISAADLAVPDDGDTVFAELHQRTDVRIIAPEEPLCAQEWDFSIAPGSPVMESASQDSVQVFASGEVGPFGFDVIGSADPQALIGWLRDNNYRVEPEMEPLINVYVEEEFAFVAMRLLEGESSDSIKPIEITYGGQKPMIPLRLTAVAANNDMPIFVWIYGPTQAVPENFEHMHIATEEITFSNFGGNDYQLLLRERANALGGRAFITEFAASGSTIQFDHRYLRSISRSQKYLTRLSTVISPHEMLADPVFGFEDRPDVSNVRDASNMTGLYDCERDNSERLLNIRNTDAINPRTESFDVVATTPPPTNEAFTGRIIWIGILLVAAVGLLAWMGRRRSQSFT
ncbi:MAG: DUF2330 domain-containing protein [Anaerolineae bacterium]